MKKLFFVLILCALMIAPQLVQADGTPVGTDIENSATVSGGNFPSNSDTNNQTVLLIVGARLDSADADVTGGIGLASYTNVSTLENLGNGTIDFNINVNQATNADAGGLWTYSVYSGAMVPIADLQDVSGSQVSAVNINLASAGSTAITIVATADALLGAGFNEFSVFATTADAYQNQAAYAGDNGTYYGANWGEIANDQVSMSNTGTADGSSDQTWRITGSGAVIISITKSIIGISDPSGAGGIIIPGATITYQLLVTNSSASPGTAVIVSDTFDVVNCDYFSMSADAGYTENNWNMGISAAGVATWTNMDVSGAFDGGNAARLELSVIIK